LVDPTGAEHRLSVDDAVIGAVRRARRAHASEAPRGDALRPRDIQAMVRSGLTADDIASETGEDVEHIRRYERPVLDERRHIAQQAGRVLVYPDTDTGSPTPLAELALERLELREVDPESMAWDAWKRQDGTWYVELTFIAGSRRRAAGWTYARGSVVAQDDEARWLSDSGPTDSGPIPDFGSGQERRSSTGDPLPPAPPRSASSRDHQTETGRILESLRRRRGVAPSPADAPDPSSTGPAGGAAEPPPAAPAQSDAQEFGAGGLRLVGDADERTIDGAHSAPSHPHEAQDASIVALPPSDGEQTETPDVAHPDQHTEPIGTPRFDTPAADPARDPDGSAVAADGTAGESAQRSTSQATDTGPGDDHPSLLDDPALADWEEAAEPTNAASSSDTAKVFPASVPPAHGAHDGRAEGDADGASAQSPDAQDTGASGSTPLEVAKRRRGRASVPSWDEIMFGGRGRD
ncbi:MAG TPA: septation protein SepH, partial [Brevibacterium sp.]|nr:septation protein SepH [Brevibacterium sp.]